jgi:hypothetical protein
MTAPPRVLLMRLSIRESAKGTPYLSGFLGCARVVAFKGKFGNAVWEVFVAEPQPKGDQAPRPEILPPERPAQHYGLPIGRTIEHREEPRSAAGARRRARGAVQAGRGNPILTPQEEHIQ